MQSFQILSLLKAVFFGGKQEALRSCFENTVLPAFERTCRSMFDHVESSFQHGMAEYTQHAQQELLSSHTALASTLQVCASSCLHRPFTEVWQSF